MSTANHLLTDLCQKIQERERRTPLAFEEFLKLCGEMPQLIVRNIFQMFHDMIYSHVGDGSDEYPDDPESIHFVFYDTSSLFIDGTDNPFFADRLFMNRLINHIVSFRRGTQQNRMYIFEGPHGCGKSTFLNNLLMKFELYTRTEEGASYETVWRLSKKDLGATSEHESRHLLAQLRNLVDTEASNDHCPQNHEDPFIDLSNKEYLEVPCPSHDNPLLMIPKTYRKDVLDRLITDENFKEKLFSEKQYEWVFRDSPCTICMSLYQTLLEMFDSPSKIYEMMFARRYQFNRRLGQGISVFNPGDRPSKTKVLTNPLLQNQLNGLLRDSNRVKYLHSRYANTNNGIFALMDVKGYNKERLANLHGIISEGVHKVEEIEENVKSLFLALMNPEDQQNIAETESFADRITYIKIPYVLDYNTEVRIYKNVFGEQIESHFLPRVLRNFAKVIISTRLNLTSEALQTWIWEPEKYSSYCDRNLQLLKMDIYTGLIPPWLTEEDRKRFTAKERQKIIAESETEGNKGITGRDSIKIFNEFFSTYARGDKLITMDMVCSFFRKYYGGTSNLIPLGFMNSLKSLYNYDVLQEVKESLYYYNEERISRDIQNYLFAVNFEPGQWEKCVYTGEEVEITEVFFESIERRLLGSHISPIERRLFRGDIQNQYTSKTLTQEMFLEGKKIHETQLYRFLYEKYVHNLKENVMDPFLENENFRRAIKDYHTDAFKSYDKRIREDVNYLIHNLKAKYGYTEQGAKEISIYVIDGNLARRFPVV